MENKIDYFYTTHMDLEAASNIQNIIDTAAIAANNKQYKKATATLFELINIDRDIFEKLLEHVLESLKLWTNCLDLNNLSKDMFIEEFSDNYSISNFTDKHQTTQFEYDSKGDIEIITLYYKKLIHLFTDRFQQFSIYFQFAIFKQRLNLFAESRRLFLQALSLKLDSMDCKIKIDKLNGYLVDRWHFRMLNDWKRNLIFKKAIETSLVENISQDAFVFLDIGAGTGLLSMYAALFLSENDENKKNKFLYACEMDIQMQRIGKDVINDNNFTDQICLLNKCSENINIPADMIDKANVLVTETFDSCLFGEHILKTLKHAHECLIKPSCTKIPSAGTVYFAAVHCSEIRKTFGFSPAEILSEINILKLIYASNTKDLGSYDSENIENYRGDFKFLSRPQSLCFINFMNYESICEYLDGITKHLTFEICASGSLDALVVWFDLHLGKDLNISTSPFPDQDVINADCWGQGIFPVNYSNCPSGQLLVTNGETIYADWYIGDGIILNKCCSTKILDPRKDDTPLFILDNSTISAFNSQVYMKSCFHSLQLAMSYIQQMQLRPSFALIGEQLIPCAILAAKCGQVELDACSNLEFLEYLVQVNNLENESIKIKNSLPDECISNSILMADIIDIQGYIKYEVLEKIVNRRSLYNFLDDGIIIPRHVNLVGMLVSCEQLQKNSFLLDDNSSYLPLKISSQLNKFKMVNYHNIELSKLPHSQLTSPFPILNLNMYITDLQPIENTVQTKTIDSGEVHALIYWFELYMFADVAISTVDQGGYWKQSAVLLDDVKVLDVEIDDLLEIRINFLDGLFFVACSVIN